MQEEQRQDYGTLVAKKSERLVTALYLVTDLMNDNEPIKHGLRKNAVALLSSMNSLAQLDVKDRVIEFKMSLKAVTEIISLLHVSVTTGIVSEMNGQLLMEGFRSLQLVLEKKQPIFTKEMLSVDDDELDNTKPFSAAVNSTSYDVMTPLSLARLHDNAQDLRKTEELRKHSQIVARMEARERKSQSNVHDVKDVNHGNILKSEENVLYDKVQSERQNISTHADIMGHVPKSEPAIVSSFQMKKSSRRDQILALFVKGVDVSIKDIAARIKGCSEKTIQRELNALLADGFIDRIGEKRWSRYVLR